MSEGLTLHPHFIIKKIQVLRGMDTCSIWRSSAEALSRAQEADDFMKWPDSISRWSDFTQDVRTRPFSICLLSLPFSCSFFPASFFCVLSSVIFGTHLFLLIATTAFHDDSLFVLFFHSPTCASCASSDNSSIPIRTLKIMTFLHPIYSFNPQP